MHGTFLSRTAYSPCLVRRIALSHLAYAIFALISPGPHWSFLGSLPHFPVSFGVCRGRPREGPSESNQINTGSFTLDSVPMTTGLLPGWYSGLLASLQASCADRR